MEEIEYVDTQESLKTGPDDMSVASLYFDETDGKYGTWKRRKLDRSILGRRFFQTVTFYFQDEERIWCKSLRRRNDLNRMSILF